MLPLALVNDYFNCTPIPESIGCLLTVCISLTSSPLIVGIELVLLVRIRLISLSDAKVIYGYPLITTFVWGIFFFFFSILKMKHLYAEKFVFLTESSNMTLIGLTVCHHNKYQKLLSSSISVKKTNMT